MQRIMNYFTNGINEFKSRTLQTVGAEIETQFVYQNGKPIQTHTSQQMLAHMSTNGWRVECRKGNLITTLVDADGNRIFYELGRHNMEVSTAATTPANVLCVTKKCLNELYEAAHRVRAKPLFQPVLNDDEDLLVIPDERDATWLMLDGRTALAPLARTSSVQFTFSVSSEDAVKILNRFGQQTDSFLADYPQDAVWKQYIRNSSAGYRPDRYGGPLLFESLQDYCLALAKHNVVQGARLVPLQHVENLDMSLYVRSVWWHFRLKRYGHALCIEVRPMPRRTDEHLEHQLDKMFWCVFTH